MTAAFQAAAGEVGRPSSSKVQVERFQSADGTTITIVKDATPDQLQEIEAAQSRVFGTRRGQQMLDKLAVDGRTIEIRINNRGDTSAPTPGGYINIDPNRLETVQVIGGRIPATIDRAMAHEFGHAIFGTSDIDLQNIILNENPIMRELGQPSRIEY